MSDDFFAPPAFKPAEALVLLQRQLREVRGLAERGSGYDWKGRAVIALAATDTTIEAKLARRPAVTPEWTTHVLKGSPDVRKFVDAVRQQAARWSEIE